MSDQTILPGVNNLNINDNQILKEQNVYKCTFSNCNKAFGKKSRLVLHERTHTGERPFKCLYESCNKSYTRNFHLTRHHAISHGSEAKVDEYLSCDHCDNMFSNKYSLEKHRKVHTSSGYNCQICGKSFRKENQLGSHMYEHTGVKSHHCKYSGCTKSFLFESKLKKHSEVHLPNRYKCYHINCQRTFNAYNHLRKHVTEHPKVCIECKEEFPTCRKLNVHLKTHGKAEIFHCYLDSCDRYYFLEKNLRVHIRTNHDPNFEGFKCQTCQKVLSTKQKLGEHAKVHAPSSDLRRKSDKPRKARKDKGVPKRSIYSVLSGYDDSKADGATVDERKQIAPQVPFAGCSTVDSCADVVARITARIEAAMHLAPQVSV